VEERTPLNARVNANCTALIMLDGLVVISVLVARLGPERPGHWIPIAARGGFLKVLDAVWAPRHTTVYWHFSHCIAPVVASVIARTTLACRVFVHNNIHDLFRNGIAGSLRLTWVTTGRVKRGYR
jgi:hypothetical protein